ncbi:tetratricopeptide repeat protein [Pseudodesulfovibrio sp.]|uniref:tetratricopeptide repeat protein n=1 Tax=Pseudodesulfovibrio sp. TaxID=2035812 RepID=UPI002620AAC4|nr:tetratricopeptide repeat protein [Pseudodesulfovibrio sp.]MDD3310772.1 tetratricopeptide repeat protein [Pseudodesulfovibrio sp.]
MMHAQTRQRLGYMALLALSAATALILYPILHKPLVLLHRAEALTREGRTAEADALVIRAVFEGARRPDAVLRAAGRLLEDGRKDQAAELLRRALGDMPTIPAGLAGRMAGLLDSGGLPDEALALLLRTGPDRRNREERLHLADLLRRRARYAEAVAEYDALLRKAPRDSEAALRKVETLSWQGSLDAALPLARELVRSDPENRPARLLLARILNWSGHTAEAEAEYKRLLGEQP